MNMSWRRGKTSGWAAFDLDQRRKLGVEPESTTESFLSVSSSISKNSNNVSLLEDPFVSVLQHSVNFPTLSDDANSCKKQLPFSSSSSSTRTAELVTEYNSGRSANTAHAMLKEIHPWADGSLIEDVLAGTDNNIYKASTLLEEMVSFEENYKENKDLDFETKALKSIAEESLVDGNKLSADKTTDLAELTGLLQEGLKSNMNTTESFPSVSSSISKNSNNVALLENPFASVLQHSVNFPTLSDDANSCKKQLSFSSSSSSTRTAELVTEYNSGGSANMAHKMLKEIHPWADGSLIEDVLADTDNNIYMASTLLEEMVSFEENYKENKDFETKALKSIAEESLVDGNKLSADKTTDLAELTCLLQEGLKSNMTTTESFPSVSSSISKNSNNAALLENPFASVLQHSVDFPTLSDDPSLCKKKLPFSSSSSSTRTAELVTEYNSERSANTAHEMLKEIHPWADGSLIEDVLAGTDNNIYMASTLLEGMVSFEENYKENKDFETKALKSIAEESLVDGNKLSVDMATDLAELTGLLQEGLKSNMNTTESFPSVSSSISKNSNNVALLENPFASVLQHSVNFPTLSDDANSCKKQLSFSSSSSSTRTAELVTEYNSGGSANMAHEMLKEIHPWADGSLIEDVLADTDNNIYMASTLLEEMVSFEENYKENKDFETKALKSIAEESLVDGNKLSADMTTDLAELTCLLQEGLKFNNAELKHECNDDLKMILNSLKHIPVEPEWEEDDVYLVHRKDALRMMRLASCHSKSANDAYSRGDHLSAQHYSQKAREERMVAKRLNEKAASEILSIRNSKNDQWTLDLHGLHLAEAVTALQGHLRKIESQAPINQLVSANGVKDKSSVMASALSVSANFCDIEKLGMQTPSSRPRPTSLQVITGRGNHSRGEPVLPVAIRSFLIENGYRFNETRPGVISVRPKFW